jgi:two-component system response regulator YesN
MLKAMIADDEKKVRIALKELGEWDSLGIEVMCECQDGDELYERAKEFKPDIVVTDMRMPGLSGAELIKSLYSLDKKIKIIVVSGYDDFEYTRQAIISKAVDYLLKPIDSEGLNSALKKAIAEIKATVEYKYKISETVESYKYRGKNDIPYKIREYLEMNYHSKISLNDLAAKFFLSKEYISKMFKQEFGVGIYNYIDFLRIEKAKEMLLEAEFTIREVAELLGFYDESHLSKKFKKLVGVSPKEYRK